MQNFHNGGGCAGCKTIGFACKNLGGAAHGQAVDVLVNGNEGAGGFFVQVFRQRAEEENAVHFGVFRGGFDSFFQIRLGYIGGQFRCQAADTRFFAVLFDGAFVINIVLAATSLPFKIFAIAIFLLFSFGICDLF